jgi:hypothetical protein
MSGIGVSESTGGGETSILPFVSFLLFFWGLLLLNRDDTFLGLDSLSLSFDSTSEAFLFLS